MIGITFLLSTILALGVATEDVQYSKEIECSVRGPKFWCQNKETALQCHATRYCEEHAWPKHQEENSIYAMCEKYATILHNYFSQNASRQAMLNALKEKCLSLPSKGLQDQCITNLNKYGNMVMDKLSEVTKDPKQFCSLMGACQSSLSLLNLKSFLPKVDADLCTSCQQYVGTVHLLISNNATQAELIQALNSICTLLPSTIAPECSALMTAYAPMIVNWLVEYTAKPINFCTTIGLCSSQITPQLVKSNMPKDVIKMSMEPVQVKVDADLCTSCQQYVGTIHLLISNNATQAELIQAMNSICTLLPSTIAPECSALMTAYAPMIVNWLVEYTAKPINFCTTIGLCSSSQITPQLVKPAMPKDALKSSMEPVQVKDTKSESITKPTVHNQVTCELCTVAMGYLDGILQENTSRAAVKNALYTVCGELPASLKEECTMLVQEYADQIMILIVDELKDITQICKELGLCSTNKVFKLASNRSKASLLCEGCLFIAGKFDEFLKSIVTDIESILDRLCKSQIPPKLVDQFAHKNLKIILKKINPWECIVLVHENLQHIIDYINQEISPDKVCKELHLCSSNSTAPLKKELPRNIVTCEVCEYAAGYLDGILEGNETESEIKAALDTLCSYLPSSLEAQCTSFVNTYTDTIIQLLVQELATPKTLCTELGLCTASKTPLKKELPRNVVTCEVCEYAASYLDGILEDDKTESTVKAALDKMCEYLPSSYGTECESFVNTYTATIIKLLVDEVATPKTLCTELGLCTAVKTPLKKELPQNIVTCEVCQYAAGYLDGILEGNKTESAIKAALDQMCQYLPSSYEAECQSLVDTYTDTIIRLLVQELATPKTLCTELGLCTATGAATTKKDHVKSVPASSNGVSCEVCTIAMGYLDEILEGSTTEALVKEGLDKLCGLLPPSLSGECDSLVNQYSDKIIKLIVSGLAPTKVCKEIGLCTSSKHVSVSASQIVAAPSATCSVCMFAMGELDAVLTKKSTEDEIKVAVESLCTRLPAFMGSECKTLIDTYGDMIISSLAQEMDPSRVCHFIGLCNAEKQFSNTKFMLAKRMGLKGVSCEVCEYAMGYLDTLLVSKPAETKIEAVVEKLCSYLPEFFKNECDALISEYGDQIIQLIAQQIKPAVVCQELRLC